MDTDDVVMMDREPTSSTTRHYIRRFTPIWNYTADDTGTVAILNKSMNAV